MKHLVLASMLLAFFASACSNKSPTQAPKVEPAPTAAKQVPRAQKKMEQSSAHINAQATFHECRAGETCKASFTVHALKGTHINTEYPHRFSTVEGVPLDFTSSKMEFAGEEEGTFYATFEGPDEKMPIEGTLAVSACDDEACFIEKMSFAW